LAGEDLKKRTKAFALRVIKLADTLPRERSADIIGRQLLRCATSVGANYRSACRAKSTADFIAKMTIVEEEADESLYWMELLAESNWVPQGKLTDLMKEADEIVSIIVASVKTARSHKA
jgi:four helix bundle protein